MRETVLIRYIGGTEEITNLRQLARMERAAKTIGITGYPGAGKTTLLHLLNTISEKQIIETDDFIKGRDHADIPGAILESIPKTDYILEGTQVSRLLSRGWKPDLLIWVEGSVRHLRDPKYAAGIRSMLDKKISEYRGKVWSMNPRKIMSLIVPENRWREMSEQSKKRLIDAFLRGAKSE